VSSNEPVAGTWVGSEASAVYRYTCDYMYSYGAQGWPTCASLTMRACRASIPKSANTMSFKPAVLVALCVKVDLNESGSNAK
jgi:hypothetical protein